MTLEDAMWAEDADALNELAPCRCCCRQHTFYDCPARDWNGCRGGTESPRETEQAWQEFYEKVHGMSSNVFYGEDDFDWTSLTYE
jgi:hypothetical protein